VQGAGNLKYDRKGSRNASRASKREGVEKRRGESEIRRVVEVAAVE
jgi:hypothetical protein